MRDDARSDEFRESVVQSNLWAFSFASFFNDVASETTIRLIPLFLSQGLGASLPIVGLIEGVAQATATLVKPLSGWLADRVPRRKPLVVCGYSLSALTKIFLLIANHWVWMLAIRFVDRIGKGVRSAPRDAIIADEAADHKRGHSFGVSQMMDTLGATVGLAIAAYVLRASTVLDARGFRLIVWITLIPAILSAATIVFGVRELARGATRKSAAETDATETGATPLGWTRRLGAVGRLPGSFWRYIAVASLFTLANSSDAFLVLKAANYLHANLGVILICLIAMNLSSTVLAIPAGRLSDRFGRKVVLGAGWAVYAVSYLAFGLAESMTVYFLAFALYGAFYGMTEATEKAFVADLVGKGERRGLAYGVFAFAIGVMSFPASLGFGYLLRGMGPVWSFVAAAVLAAVSTIALFACVRESAPSRAARAAT